MSDYQNDYRPEPMMAPETNTKGWPTGALVIAGFLAISAVLGFCLIISEVARSLAR